MLTKFKSYLSRSEEVVFYILLGLATAILMLELRSLYSTPVPDSYLWWGDESWLMIEFRTQILEGVFRHPYALGSSLVHGSGIVFGNMWVPALFYGIPAAFVTPMAMDIVLLGRTVTAIFALTLLVALYEIVRRLTSDRLLALFSILLLLTSRSFLLTSHSARYDILNALAIIVGIFLLLRLKTGDEGTVRYGLIGFLTAATLLITVHVTLALTLAAVVTIFFRSGKNRRKALVLLIAGAIIFSILLVGISALIGQATLFGSHSTSGFTINLHDIPAPRFYRRSVQLANIVQRWGMFSALGFGYILVFAAITLLGIIALARKALSLSGRWHGDGAQRAVIFFTVFISWFELESSAPTSYLIYLLPVLSLAAALAMKRLLHENVRTWVIAALSIMLCVLAIKNMPGVHGKGYRIMTSNYQAVGAALAEIDQADSNRRPLVLAFNPAVHEVLRDTTVRLMTTQFVGFPESTASVDSVLRKEGVKYVLFYLSSLKPDYMSEVGPIDEALARIATPIWERPGYFTDIGRTYFDSTLGTPDTLRLYRLHD